MDLVWVVPVDRKNTVIENKGLAQSTQLVIMEPGFKLRQPSS